MNIRDHFAGLNKKAHVRFLFALLLGAFLPQLIQASTATEYYSAGDYEQAYFLFKNMALTGNHDAQFNLGVMYLKGQLVEKDYADAYAWIKLAGAGGDERYSQTADKVFSQLTEKGKEAAIKSYDQKNNLYSDEVINNYLSPQPLPDEECAVEASAIKLAQPKYPARAARKGLVGIADVKFNISSEGLARDIQPIALSAEDFLAPTVLAIQKSIWQPKETADGKRLLTRNVQYRFVYKIKGGRYYTKPILKKAEELSQQAETGDPSAQYDYGIMLSTLRSFDEQLKGKNLEYKDANEWFHKAAESGNIKAQYQLGMSFAVGKGCAVDHEKSRILLNSAASSGHYLAQTELAMSPILTDSEGMGGRVYWLRKAAGAGHDIARLYLAWELATNADPQKNQPKEALALIGDLVVDNYFDSVRVAETRAAVFAANGKYKKAVEYQQEAFKEAESLGWKSPIIENRLHAYKNKQAWSGSYHL